MIDLVAMGIGLNGLDKGCIGPSAGNAMQMKPDMRQDEPTGACRTIGICGLSWDLRAAGACQIILCTRPRNDRACSWMQHCSADAAVQEFRRAALLALLNCCSTRRPVCVPRLPHPTRQRVYRTSTS